MKEVLIRHMIPGDNPGIAALIRRVLEDMGVPKTGTAYADESLDELFTFYSKARSVYLVVEAGIRRMGTGNRMLRQLLLMAEDFGYKQCYLETMPYMETAQSLYRKFGFEYLPAPMGNTGHHSCQLWILLNLQTTRVP